MAFAGSVAEVAVNIDRPAGSSMTPRRVLLVSNRVMHYRVSVYNYFWNSFREHGWGFSVLSNELQKQNQNRCQFGFVERPFSFRGYRSEIRRLKPDVVILFLHMKDLVLWPLIHWLKASRIPVVLWTKARNLDDVNNRIRNAMFDYLHWLSDGLILYTDSVRRFVPMSQQHKVFIANNTLNFEEFPEISESKEQIKKELGIQFEKVVLFAGRIAEEGNRKKVDHLIDIFRDLNRADVGLIIVGSGFHEELRARMNPVNTRYLGEVHDPKNIQISRIFKMADICCIPGHVGLGLNQAFYWGLPMVTEAGNQPPEIAYLQHGENGFIVGENDRTALRDRLLFLIDHERERKRMSANARNYILSNASIQGMFHGFLSCVSYVSHCSYEQGRSVGV